MAQEESWRGLTKEEQNNMTKAEQNSKTLFSKCNTQDKALWKRFWLQKHKFGALNPDY